MMATAKGNSTFKPCNLESLFVEDQKKLFEHAYSYNDTPVRPGYTIVAQIDTQQGFQTWPGV